MPGPLAEQVGPALHDADLLGGAARQVERARHLVRLHADHHDHAGVGGLDQFGDAVAHLTKQVDVSLT